jgi:hypothetical protein
MMCEIFLYSFITIGALVIGVLIGWGVGFLHGNYWRVK